MRILVADDHTLFREGLRYILKDLSPELDVLEADGLDAARIVLDRTDGIEIALVDLNMPGMDRDRSLRELHQAHPQVRIVVLSASEDRADVRRALSQGAKGFIPKSSSRDVMVSALRLVLSGGTYLPPVLIGDFDPLAAEDPPTAALAAFGAPDADGLKRLTRRQHDVLACLAEGKSNKEIARQLGLAEGTVKIHIAGILKALKVNNRTQAIIAAGKVKRGT